MSDQDFETIDLEALTSINGGLQMDPNARWIMQRESGGRTTAKNPHSTAFGAFQMLKATRKQYMGSNWQSTSLEHQYAGASKYVKQRYGSWANAKRFWQSHHWY